MKDGGGGKREEGVGGKGGTTFLFSALPGDLKTPPKRPFRLFRAFGQSGRGRLGGLLRLLVAVAPGGFSCRGLLRPRAGAAAAILKGRLRLRNRWFHPVVSAATSATAFPARVRRRGLRLRSSRHREGVKRSRELPPTRSTGVGGKGGGPGRRGLGPPGPSASGSRTPATETPLNRQHGPERASRPGSRSGFGRLFNRPRLPNVLASGPGGGGASADPLYQ